MATSIRHRRSSYLLLIASLSAIGFATIYPFKFVIPEGLSIRFVFEEFNYSSNLKDYLQNVLLFIPLGISLAAIATLKGYSKWWILGFGCLSGALVSSTVEFTQLFLPIRVSNLADIICNSLGGLLGAALYHWRRDLIGFAIGVITCDRHRLSVKSLSIAIVSYCFIVAVAIWILLINVNLSNWNKDFYLTIGNEVTGDRPWNGYLNTLYISDRSLTELQAATAFNSPDSFFSRSTDVVTALKATENSNFTLQNSQNLDLSWHNTLSASSRINKPVGDRQMARNTGILLSKEQWLKTEQPAFFINQQLKNSSEFNIFLTVATTDLTQTGPARIIALSDSIYTQNLLLGQEGSSLIFRLRTPITGNDPTQPEFSLSNFFNDYNYHQILVTFAERKLTFYIDRIENQYSFVFTPSVSFYSYLPWNIANWNIDLKELNMSKYQYLFYTIIILPLIVLVGELAILFIRESKFK